MLPSQIWLADFLRAVSLLDADPQTTSQIAKLLGMQAPMEQQFIFADSHDEKSRQPGSRSTTIGERVDLAPVMPTPRPPVSTPTVTPAEASDSEASIPADLVELPQLPIAQVEFSYAEVLPEDKGTAAASALLPLLPRKQVRNMLSRVLSLRSQTGPWDIPSAVECAARGKLLKEIPRLPVPTLAGGVQLLVDGGAAVTVYAEDYQWLEHHMLRVVGRDKMSILGFTGNPQFVFDPADPSQRAAYSEHLPRPRTVVAALTDLGIGRPPGSQERSSARQWLELAQVLRRRRCPLVAFVPYGRQRWPAILKKDLTIVHFDWTTNSGSLAALAGKGLSL